MADVEVAVTTESSGEHDCISFWDIKSGMHLKSYKGGICSVHGLTFVGHDYLIGAQHEKQILHVWNTRKLKVQQIVLEASCQNIELPGLLPYPLEEQEQLHMKIVCPGKITAISCTPDGHYCAVALVDKIYIWQVATGNLMRILARHYQAVTCLKVIDDGGHFISAGDDNLVIVWNLASVLSTSDELPGTESNQKPLHTWSDHSLPVKDVYVSKGGCRCRVATCSLDQTCKLYDLASGELLCSLIFDTGLTAVTMDAAETRLFVGCVNGMIHIINLFSSNLRKEQHVENDQPSSNVLSGHSKHIVALSVTMDGGTLLSGSADCTARLWHINSRQCIRTLSYKGPVTNAMIVNTPPAVSGSGLPRLHVPISNFKRSLHRPLPASRHGSFQDNAGDNGIPCILKNVHEDHLNSCRCPSSLDFAEKNERLLIADIISHYGKEQKTESTRSRAELENHIEKLEKKTKQLYEFAADKLIMEINQEQNEAMEMD